jgi:hypothetical protein
MFVPTREHDLQTSQIWTTEFHHFLGFRCKIWKPISTLAVSRRHRQGYQGRMGSQPPGPDGNQEPFAAPLPAESTLPFNRTTTPHRNVKPLFRISTTYSTIAARAISFQRQLLTGITPHQLAQNGLYHQVRAGVGDIACCFACENAVPLGALQEYLTGDLSKIHKADCLWQVICHDLKPFLPSLPHHACTPSPVTPSTQTTAL